MPLDKIFSKFKAKDAQVGTEVERANDVIRSALRGVDAMGLIPDLAATRRYIDFLDAIRKKEHLRGMMDGIRNERGAVILMALRERPRAAASHSRSLRGALRRMAADLRLRGKWLDLVSAREVLALCETNGPQDRRSHPSAGTGVRTGTADADGDRVILLG